MARKARHWENWKAAKQEEMRQSGQRWTDDKAQREEECEKGLHKVFGAGNKVMGEDNQAVVITVMGDLSLNKDSSMGEDSVTTDIIRGSD